MYYDRYDDILCGDEDWRGDGLTVTSGASNDLYDVIDRSDDAREYFMSLPREIREMLEAKNSEICSPEALRLRAGDLLDG